MWKHFMVAVKSLRYLRSQRQICWCVGCGCSVGIGILDGVSEPKWLPPPPTGLRCPDLCDSGIMALLLAHTARIFILYICSPWHNVPLYIVCMLLEWRLLRSETDAHRSAAPRERRRDAFGRMAGVRAARAGGSSHWEEIYEYEFVVLTTDCMSVLYRATRTLLSFPDERSEYWLRPARPGGWFPLDRRHNFQRPQINITWTKKRGIL